MGSDTNHLRGRLDDIDGPVSEDRLPVSGAAMIEGILERFGLTTTKEADRWYVLYREEQREVWRLIERLNKAERCVEWLRQRQHEANQRALTKITTRDERFLADVQAEAARARLKFPETPRTPGLCLAALVEEVGELANALIEHNRTLINTAKKPTTAADVYKEAVQVANMALIVATQGDAAFPYSMDAALIDKEAA